MRERETEKRKQTNKKRVIDLLIKTNRCIDTLTRSVNCSIIEYTF